MTETTLLSRYRGALLGLAAGDALGTTVEFRSPGTFEPLTDIIGGGPFGLEPGQWTDDTSLALCLAESLVEGDGFDPQDQLRRYVRWYRHGYLSSTGECFDIGHTTREALHRFERTGEPFCGPTASHTAGNGSLMRLAPVPLCFAADPGDQTLSQSAMSRPRPGHESLTGGMSGQNPSGWVCFVPTILRSGAFRVVVYTNDHEPAHVHVWCGTGEVKVDISGSRARIVDNRGVARTTAAQTLRLVQEHRSELLAAWRRIHGA